MNKESLAYAVVFTFLVAFLFVFIIALADDATAEQVARNQELVTAKAFLNVLGITENDDTAALKTYKELFKDVQGENIVKAALDGKPVLVKQFSGQGLWGTVVGVIATDANASRILGLDIIRHAETPGLGGRIEEAWFKDQFRNEKIGPAGVAVRKGEGGSDTDPENASIDGITGATLTSASMEVILNNEIAKLREAK